MFVLEKESQVQKRGILKEKKGGKGGKF